MVENERKSIEYGNVGWMEERRMMEEGRCWIDGRMQKVNEWMKWNEASDVSKPKVLRIDLQREEADRQNRQNLRPGFFKMSHSDERWVMTSFFSEAFPSECSDKQLSHKMKINPWGFESIKHDFVIAKLKMQQRLSSWIFLGALVAVTPPPLLLVQIYPRTLPVVKAYLRCNFDRKAGCSFWTIDGEGRMIKFAQRNRWRVVGMFGKVRFI